MPYKFFNPNPKFQRVGDCVVRAICKAIGVDWQEAYISLCAEGLSCKDMPSANYVWGRLLNRYGYVGQMISSICPQCVTVAEFANDHPEGRYVLSTQNHVVAVIDGDYYDTWDSGNEVILYFYKKEI